MSDQQATTIRSAVVAQCRAVVEQHDTTDHQRSVSETVAAALVAPIRRPRGTILALGAVFVIVSGIASLVTSGIGEAIRIAALFGVLSFAALLLTNDHRPTATDHQQPTHADESGENSTQRTTVMEED